MAKMVFFPFYPNSYLSSPGVTTAELIDEGIYLRLLCFEWMSPGCQLPDDMPYLRKLCKGARSARILSVLERHFERIELDKGKFYWRNPRLFAEFSRSLQIHEKRKQSANYRWHKEKPDASAMQEQCECNAITDTVTVTDTKDLKPSKRHFVPPTVEEVQAYCLERGNGISAVAFVAHYANRDWKVGKYKMKSWKQAIITWEERRKEDKKNVSKSFFQSDRDEQESIKSRSRALLRRGPDLAGKHDQSKMELGTGEDIIQGEVVEVPEMETPEA